MAWIEQRNRGGYQDSAYKYDDDILFEHEDEIHGQHRFELVEEWNKQNHGDRRRADQAGALAKNQKYSWMRDKMTKALWETRYGQLMAENLIVVPKNFYEDKLPFNDTETLNQIFTELEEKNLNFIKTL